MFRINKGLWKIKINEWMNIMPRLSDKKCSLVRASVHGSMGLLSDPV